MSCLRALQTCVLVARGRSPVRCSSAVGTLPGCLVRLLVLDALLHHPWVSAEKKQRQLEQAKEVMAENSKALRVEVDGIKGEMTQFAAGLGLLEGNLDNLEQVEQGLQRLTDAVEANQNIERELAKHEQQFAKAQNEYLEEKEKENFKDQFVKGGLFDLATDDGLIDSPEEIKNVSLWGVRLCSSA